MASFAMHLVIAKLYLKAHEQENEDEFIEGTIIPDLTDDKSITHYGKHSAWADPRKFLKENGENLNSSFKRAYFLHLLTDYLFYHKLIDIDKYVEKLGKDEWIKRQRNDFSILNDEIIKKYQLDNIPDQIKQIMISKDGELAIFERNKLFRFLEEVAKVNIDEIAQELLKNPNTDLLDIFKRCSLLQENDNTR